MNPSGQSQVVNDRKDQFFLGASLGCRHHLESAEQKLGSPQKRFRTPANINACERALQNLHSDQNKEGKDRNREIHGWRDNCWGGFWIWTLQMHTSSNLFSSDPSVIFAFFLPPQVIIIPGIQTAPSWQCMSQGSHEFLPNIFQKWFLPKEVIAAQSNQNILSVSRHHLHPLFVHSCHVVQPGWATKDSFSAPKHVQTTTQKDWVTLRSCAALSDTTLLFLVLSAYSCESSLLRNKT